jgi:hypothetical protein
VPVSSPHKSLADVWAALCRPGANAQTVPICDSPRSMVRVAIVITLSALLATHFAVMPCIVWSAPDAPYTANVAQILKLPQGAADLLPAPGIQKTLPMAAAPKYKVYPTLTAPDIAAIEHDIATSPLASTRKRHHINRIYQLHADPLVGRIPIVIMPGRAEEFQPNAWWEKLSALCDSHPELRRRYKLFVYIYDSYDTLPNMVSAFQHEMHQLFKHYPAEQPLGVVSYSLGGVILRDAVASDWLVKQLDTAIAMGVPFHGSPLFEEAWYPRYIRVHNHSPIRKWWVRSMYQAYMGNKDHLIEALSWHDFDASAMPQRTPQAVASNNNNKAYQEVGQMNALPPQVWSPNQAKLKSKMIIYASYLKNRFNSSDQKLWTALGPTSVPKIIIKSPRMVGEFAGLFLPASGLTLHSIFQSVNYELSTLPASNTETGEMVAPGLYRYNDGTVPLSSALFLPSRSRPYTEEPADMAKLSDAAKVRIFANIDHMDLGHYRWPETPLLTQDTMHPEDGALKPNEWIFNDLNLAFGFTGQTKASQI